MSRAGFGKDVDIFENLIKYAVGIRAQGPLEPWEVPYFIRSFYDQLFHVSERCYIIKDGHYEIKSFDDKTNPLRMVSKTVREGLTENNALRRRAWEYRTYKINEVQGMSFKEWLAQPPFILDMILNDIRKEEEIRQAIAKSHNNDIDRMTKNDGSAALADSLLNNSKALR